jgi:hypothetical protein
MSIIATSFQWKDHLNILHIIPSHSGFLKASSLVS